MRRFLRIIPLFVLILLTACSSQPTVTYSMLPAKGDPVAGQDIYQHGTSSAQACSSCHSTDGSAEVGPTYKGLATRASTRVQGQSADEYLFNSIVAPNAYIVDGFSADIMPNNYGRAFSAQQLRDVIAYLATLN